jgi:CelD/BcsL family acetyltransferase involved in cellulose biosynthesis
MTAATATSVAPATGARINDDKPPISTRPAGTRVELTPLAQLAGTERPQWDALFEAQRGVANPFCAPEWVEAWYETFSSAEDRFVYTVRDGERLSGVAPFFRSRVVARRATVAKRLQLVGAGQGGSLLELPQILAAPGQEREVLREVVTTTLTADTGAHWVETSVTPSMAWFEPQWVTGTDHPVAFHRHQVSRASVIVPLDGAWITTRSGLKRNVKESLRRSKNRIAKDGRPWAVHSHTDSLDREVVSRFLELHRSRAAQDQSTSHHPDAFSDPARRAMMRTVLPALGRRNRARILELELGGRIVAAQLVLHAPGLTYIHSSGFTADVWDLGPVTFLQGEAISAAADRGERWINMSPGPNVAKLRWSESLDVHHDFAFGAGGRGLRWRYSAFTVAQAQSQASHAFEMGSDRG